MNKFSIINLLMIVLSFSEKVKKPKRFFYFLHFHAANSWNNNNHSNITQVVDKLETTLIVAKNNFVLNINNKSESKMFF